MDGAAARSTSNILEANLCLSESGAAGAALTGDRTVRRGVNRFTPTFPGGIYQASDGWIGVTALTPPQWRSLCDMIGRPELAKNPQHLVSLQRMDRCRRARQDPGARPSRRSRRRYWLEEGQRRRIPMAPVPDLEGTAGHAALARARQLRAGRRREGRGCAGDAVSRDGAAARRRAAQEADGPRRTCRSQGLRVLDLTMGWAGPLAARHFADLGADVVKVESCSHFDWWRGFDGSMDGDPPPYETRPSFLMVNRNKRGITLDLKSETGKALTRKLAAQRRPRDRELCAGRARQARRRCEGADRREARPDLRADGRVRRERAVEQLSRLWLDGRAGVGPAVRQWRGRRSADHAACRLWRSDRRHLWRDRRPDRAATSATGATPARSSISARSNACSSSAPTPSSRSRCRPSRSSATAAAIRCRRCARSLRPTARTGWIALSVETATQWNALASAIGRPDLGVDDAADIAAMKAREAEMERAVAAAFASERRGDGGRTAAGRGRAGRAGLCQHRPARRSAACP